jgi:hypothetical protein
MATVGNTGDGDTIQTLDAPGVPVANDDAFVALFDAPLWVPADGVLANDAVVASPTLAALLVDGPANGRLVLNADGSFTYTPDPGFVGGDSFTYRVSDGPLLSDPATVGIVVLAPPLPPVADDDSFATDEDVPLVVAAAGVLLGDTDLNGGPLTARLVAAPTHGQLTLGADGGFVYVPNPDFSGIDGFTYVASDGSLDSDVATVTIAVAAINDAPLQLALSNDAVAETAGPGTVVGVLSAVDPDGDVLDFALAGDAGPFAIVGDELRVVGGLDFETQALFPLTLVATDPGGLAVTRDITIAVIDVAEAAPDTGFRFSSGSAGAGLYQAPPAATDGFAVTAGGGVTLVECTAAWNGVKNLAGPLGGWTAAIGPTVVVANFVDVRVDFSAADQADLVVSLVGVKRGTFTGGGGDDTLDVFFHSNGGTFREVLVVATGDGDDAVNADTVANTTLDEQFLADNPDPLNGALWDAAYDGRFSVLEVDAGSGDDVVTAAGVRLVARGGAGDDTLLGGLRDDHLDGGAGRDLYRGGAGDDVFILRAGEVEDDAILDFTPGDVIHLVGFGAGAGLAEVAPGLYAIAVAGVAAGSFSAAGGLAVGTDVIFVSGP